jgi:hypothetical protein
MKKIDLSKQTLRVLTAQESGLVAGGAITMPRTRCPTSQMPECEDTNACPTAYNCPTGACTATCACTVGCATNNCGTNGCPPATTNNPRARCACPDV